MKPNFAKSKLSNYESKIMRIDENFESRNSE